MPEPEDNTQETGQGSKGDEGQEDITPEPGKDTSKETSPEAGKKQDKPIDYEKSYKELQPKLTTVTQELSDAKKHIEKLEASVSEKKPEGKPEDEDLEKTLEAEIKYLEEQNYSATPQKAVLKILRDEKKRHEMDSFNRREMQDYENFVGVDSGKHQKELNASIYSMNDLLFYKKQASGEGRDLNLKACRAMWIADHQEEYTQAVLKQKEDAQRAKTQGGEEPTPEKQKGEAEKMMDKLLS